MPCYSRGSSTRLECSSSTRQQRRGHTRTRRSRATTVAALFVLGAVSTKAFTVSQRQPSRLTSTRRYFHNGIAALDTQDLSQQAQQDLPTWLSRPRAHLVEDFFGNLQQAMVQSFFSENETLKLVYAIQEASGGDRNKMAGAAEFCLILVETMEMGLSSLVAAAFHYCSCVTARESLHSNESWQQDEHPSLISFGEGAVAIARDAANLKRLEMVAAEISPSNSYRVAPDAKDSDNLQRLLLTESKDWRALAIRSAACLYRLRGIAEGDLTPEAVRVARESLYIYAPLASRLGMHRLKNELEGTAFRVLYRRQYDKLQEGFDNGIGDKMSRVLEEVTQDVREMLAQDEDFSSMAENVSVTARVKEPYSMWKKMLRDDLQNVRHVPDTLALRIVFDAASSEEEDELTRAKERALCYYVRELCTRRWQPLAGNARFKDYVESPKANGYQSLHYTASTHWGGEDWTMEIQIRSGEMHRVAEYGLASHWDYKAKSTSGDDESPQSADAYIRSVQDWHWQHHSGTVQWDAVPPPETPVPVYSDQQEAKLRADRIRARTARLAPYIEALSKDQSNMVLEHVFVFISQDSAGGKVIALPAGACVLDALREGERSLQLNWRDSLVTHNGSMANVTQKLKNGDILTVPLVSQQP